MSKIPENFSSFESEPVSNSFMEAARWQIGFALFDSPRSVSEALKKADITRIGEIAERYGLSMTDAAYSYVESQAIMSDPLMRRSLRQAEAGQLEELVLPEG